MWQRLQEHSVELLSRLLTRELDVNVVSEDSPEVILQEPGLVSGAQDHDAVIEGSGVDARRVLRV